MTSDDRQAFAERVHVQSAQMAVDPEVRELAVRTIAASDVYGYSYFWTWLGVPIIQMPEDIVATQEIIWENRPQVVIETGFARGGSALLYSSMLALLGEGLVVSVDIDVRAHNRAVVEGHPLGGRIKLVEGSSIAPETLDRVRALVPPGSRVMVVLDSDHSHQHVLEELRTYGPFVTEGQFLVVADTALEEIPRQTHRPRAWGPGDNPKTALDEYLRECDRFVIDRSTNDKLLLSSSRGGYLRCLRP